MATITRTPDEVVEALSAGCLPCELAAQAAETATDLEEPEAPAKWEGILTYEGQMTGDGRIIEKDALRWDTLPIPLRWVPADTGAHAGAVVVGRINEIERRDDGAIWAAGDFDLGSEKGREAARQVAEGLTPGVSIDLDDVSFEVRVASEAQIDGDLEDIDEDGRVKRMAMNSDDELTITTAGRIRAATLVAIQAFEPARLAIAASGFIELTASGASLLASYNPDQIRIPAGNGDLSGRWLDMPSTLIENLISSLGGSRPNDITGHIRQAQDLARAADKQRYVNGPKHSELLDQASVSLSEASRLARAGKDRKLAKDIDHLIEQVDDFKSVDFSDAPEADDPTLPALPGRGGGGGDALGKITSVLNNPPAGRNQGQLDSLQEAVNAVENSDDSNRAEALQNLSDAVLNADDLFPEGTDDIISGLDESISNADSPLEGPPGPKLKPGPIGPNRDIIRPPELPPDLGSDERQAEIDVGVDEAGNPIKRQPVPIEGDRHLKRKSDKKTDVVEKPAPVSPHDKRAARMKREKVIGEQETKALEEQPGGRYGDPDNPTPYDNVSSADLVDMLGGDPAQDDAIKTELKKRGDKHPGGLLDRLEEELTGRKTPPRAAAALVLPTRRFDDIIENYAANLDLDTLFAVLDDVETFNWVDDVGGLPQYIKRIKKHLVKKGMTESHAIATAVNVVKKACATGDLNFPGIQQENAGSRAEACAAVADWERKKAQAHVTSGETQTFGFNPDQIRVPQGNGELSGRWVDMPGTVLSGLLENIRHLGSDSSPNAGQLNAQLETYRKDLDVSVKELQDNPVGTARFNAALRKSEQNVKELRTFIEGIGPQIDNEIVDNPRGGVSTKNTGRSQELLDHLDEVSSNLSEFNSVDWFSDPDFDPMNPVVGNNPDPNVHNAPDIIPDPQAPPPPPKDLPGGDVPVQGIPQDVERRIDKIANSIAKPKERALTPEELGKIDDIRAKTEAEIDASSLPEDEKSALKKIISKVPKSTLDVYAIFQNAVLWLREFTEKYISGSDDPDYFMTTFTDTLLHIDEYIHTIEQILNIAMGRHSAQTVTAGAFPLQPPVAWFADPKFTGPTALKVDKDGRVYGHLAVWGTCHTGYPNSCVTPPSSPSNYAFFRTGSVFTDDGQEIATGRITMDTLHAGKNLTGPASLAHYENTGRAVADVAAGEDAYGIWVAGALRPDITDEQARTLRASPLSGDWRRYGSSLELIGALAVNVPGFPIPRPSGIAASGAMRTLVAAGMLHPDVEEPVVPLVASAAEVLLDGIQNLSTDDVAYLRHLAAKERKSISEEATSLFREVTAADLAYQVGV